MFLTYFHHINLSVFLCGVFVALLYWSFIIAVAVQCGYALYFFIRILWLPRTKEINEQEWQPVSIIICAKNEAENLKKNLPAILAQKYHNEAGKPMYEVIVVNDASTDSTTHILQELELKYDNLWDVVISPEAVRDLKGKKFALSKGVAIARYDLLLLTDADCMPTSSGWLRQMVTPLLQGKEIVAGYGGYYKNKGLLNAFIRWETLHTFLQYSTYAQAGKPYMAVGRNMACTKKALLKAQANDKWNALPSGDDDLLVNIAGTASNTAIVADRPAHTSSEGKETVKEWIVQKQRHLSTGKYYKTEIQLLLGGYGVSHAAMWLSFFILLFFACPILIAQIMAVRCAIYWILWIATNNRLGEKNRFYLFPFFDIGWMVYNFAFLPYITLKNRTNWK